MTETFEERTTERADIQRYLDVARRRAVHFLIPLFVGFFLVWGASWVVTPRYKSGTLILVEEPTVPKSFVEPNVSDDMQERLQSMTQQILSKTRLLVIIDKLHLYSDGGSQMSADDKVERMRKDIDIELVRDSRDQITSFRIFYSARTPLLAQQVTGALTNLFITDNLNERQQESEDTTKFLESQLEAARTNLAEQEAKVQQFEAAHEGELPTQEASNLQILSGLQAQLQNEQDALNTAKQQRVYLQSMVAQARTMHTVTRTVDGVPSSLSTIDQELSALRAKLADLSSRYTDRYPDVVSVKEQIAKAEKRRSDLIAEMKTKSNSGALADDDSAARDAADPSQNSSTLQLQGQLQVNQAEIANREQSVASLKSKINEYQGRLNAEPASEQQLDALTRGYNQSKANYDDLLKKQNDSQMATSMERMQQSERFTMLDPPSLPVKPDFPNRLKFCGIGLGVGLALGLIVAGGLEFMDDRLHSEKEIKALLSMAVISEIPEVTTTSGERLDKMRNVLGWTTAALVVTSVLAASAFSYFRN